MLVYVPLWPCFLAALHTVINWVLKPRSGASLVGGAVLGALYCATCPPQLMQRGKHRTIRYLVFDTFFWIPGVGRCAQALSDLPREASPTGLPVDRTQLIVDLGSSSLSLTLLQISDGLFHPLASSYNHALGGNSIDDRLVKYFAKEFTKKTKMDLTVCPPGDSHDARAEASLRLALEHTKRTVSASPGAATCSVESLKDGLDFTGTINRLRFDMEARSIYSAVQASIEALLKEAGRDWLHIDEIVYVGGSACLPGLDTALAAHYPEDVVTPFSTGTVIGGKPHYSFRSRNQMSALQLRIILLCWPYLTFPDGCRGA